MRAALRCRPSGREPRAPQANGQGNIYRRADLIKLMQTDRARYEAMNDEITLAYREGRVR